MWFAWFVPAAWLVSHEKELLFGKQKPCHFAFGWALWGRWSRHGTMALLAQIALGLRHPERIIRRLRRWWVLVQEGTTEPEDIIVWNPRGPRGFRSYIAMGQVHG